MASKYNVNFGNVTNSQIVAGDYNQVASFGGYTYVVRDQGFAKTKGEAPPLVANPDGSNTLVLTEAGKGHQHQTTWVALVRNR